MSEQQLRNSLLMYARKRFGLDSVPMLRALFVMKSVWGPILLLVMHHITSDLWSLVVLLEDLGQVYQVLVLYSTISDVPVSYFSLLCLACGHGKTTPAALSLLCRARAGATAVGAQPRR